MKLRSCRGKSPVLGSKVFIADSADVIGDVHLGDNSSVWFNVTIRGDVMPIKIGKETNIQDNSVLHGSLGYAACTLGDRVTVGHSVVLHGCTIQDGCLIGMGSIVMDKAVIGEHSIVAAGSLVTEGKVFPPRSMIIGRPAVLKRSLTEAEVSELEKSADNYLQYKEWYEN
jgi:carbonic anhydrase/acetyltransferase-like protein (isoleucine patch superfamily)